MQTYLILRRGGWATAQDLKDAGDTLGDRGRPDARRHPLDPQLRHRRDRRLGRHRLRLPGHQAPKPSASTRGAPTCPPTRSSPSPTPSSCAPTPNRCPRDRRFGGAPRRQRRGVRGCRRRAYRDHVRAAPAPARRLAAGVHASRRLRASRRAGLCGRRSGRLVNTRPRSASAGTRSGARWSGRPADRPHHAQERSMTHQKSPHGRTLRAIGAVIGAACAGVLSATAANAASTIALDRRTP